MRGIAFHVAILWSLIGSTFLAAQETPIILEIEAIYDDGRISPPGDTLFIRGLNFGVLTEPRVVLTTDLTTDLEIIDFSDTEILALCPNQNCPVGSSVVVAVLDDSEAVSFFNTRMVSFGAVGPKGDPGGSGDLSEILESVYPIGSIYINANEFDNPASLLGFGVWEAFGTGRVPVGFDSDDSDFDSLRKMGGEKSHTLTISEVPPAEIRIFDGRLDDNKNGFSGADITSGGDGLPFTTNGGGEPHNNLQPYIVVQMWRRTN